MFAYIGKPNLFQTFMHSTPNAIIALNRNLRFRSIILLLEPFNFGSEDICGKYIEEVLIVVILLKLKKLEKYSMKIPL